MRIELGLKTGVVILLALLVVLYVVVPFVLARDQVVSLLLRECGHPAFGSARTRGPLCGIATFIGVSVSGVFFMLYRWVRK